MASWDLHRVHSRLPSLLLLLASLFIYLFTSTSGLFNLKHVLPRDRNVQVSNIHDVWHIGCCREFLSRRMPGDQPVLHTWAFLLPEVLPSSVWLMGTQAPRAWRSEAWGYNLSTFQPGKGRKHTGCSANSPRLAKRMRNYTPSTLACFSQRLEWARQLFQRRAGVAIACLSQDRAFSSSDIRNEKKETTPARSLRNQYGPHQIIISYYIEKIINEIFKKKLIISVFYEFWRSHALPSKKN